MHSSERNNQDNKTHFSHGTQKQGFINPSNAIYKVAPEKEKTYA